MRCQAMFARDLINRLMGKPKNFVIYYSSWRKICIGKYNIERLVHSRIAAGGSPSWTSQDLINTITQPFNYSFIVRNELTNGTMRMMFFNILLDTYVF